MSVSTVVPAVPATAPSPARGLTRLLDSARGAMDVIYREMIKFGVVGILAFVIDLGLANLLWHTVLSDKVTEGRIWQNLTVERYRQAFPIAIQPFVIRQDSELDDGLVREWEPPDFGIDKHYGYAFQWFALAATLFGFYAVTQFGPRFRRKNRPAP